MDFLRAIVHFFVDLFFIRKRRQAERRKRKMEEERARREAAEASGRIREDVNNVEGPTVDPSPGADDPGGFGGWNRRR
jgi:hypothetical protein